MARRALNHARRLYGGQRFPTAIPEIPPMDSVDGTRPALIPEFARPLAPGTSMKQDPLDSLVEQLSDGDMEAAERVFVAFEPYLRMAVRRKLPARYRAKFDSVDVIQSVWAHVLRGFRDAGWRFSDAAHLRAFLVRVTNNRFIDRWRSCRTSVSRERPLSELDLHSASDSRQPSPSEVAQAEELWERMLAHCPPAHVEVLRLRSTGVAVSEIAARSGMHEGSVHRILHKLACQVAVERLAKVGPRRTGT